MSGWAFSIILHSLILYSLILYSLILDSLILHSLILHSYSTVAPHAGRARPRTRTWTAGPPMRTTGCKSA